MSGKVVLIVDDNRGVVESLGLLLRLNGFTVLEAFDGTQAIAHASFAQPHGVVLDLGLPDMSGFDVARVLRAQAWGAAAVFVAMTGWADESHVKGLFDHHLVKPADADQLTALLR